MSGRGLAPELLISVTEAVFPHRRHGYSVIRNVLILKKKYGLSLEKGQQPHVKEVNGLVDTGIVYTQATEVV